MSTSETFANEILEKFAKNYETIAQYLPLPVLFDSKEVKEMVYRDRHIKRVLELGRNANIAIFSVGTVRDNALFFRLGYADAQEKAYLKSHAVGDICSRFFDKDGNISSQELNDRTVGIALDDLRNKEYSILLSGGEGKIASIRAALKGATPTSSSPTSSQPNDYWRRCKKRSCHIVTGPFSVGAPRGAPLRDMYDFPISLLKNTPNPSRSVHAAPPTTTGISARLLTTNNEPLTIGKGVSPFPYSQALSGRAVMLAQALLMAAAIIFLPAGRDGVRPGPVRS